jgi:hypothetical protein
MKQDAYKSCQDDKFRAKFAEKQFMEVKYWSMNPSTGEFQFSPEGCAEKMESFTKIADKFFNWIYED